MMKPADIAAKRYATKVFDAKRRVSDDDFAQLMAVMRLTPSSVNTQPWHFFVAADDDAKIRLAAAAAPADSIYAYNAPKILAASHSVLFCAKRTLSDDYLHLLSEAEQADGRYKSPEARSNYQNTRQQFVNINREDARGLADWCARQVYLNIGASLMAAAQMGIDALPMEGIDTEGLNKALDLSSKDLQPLAIVCFGYAAQDDFNADLPKSRLPMGELFTQL